MRIIVADDNPAFLQRLVSLLASEFDVVATAADGKSALKVIRDHRPDSVVMDLEMPGLNSIEVTKELTKNLPSPPVVICSVETDPQVVEAALAAGALAYVFKVRVEKDLIGALRSVIQGKPFVSPGQSE
jgi:two-component system, NarL family, response regulator DegU